MGSEKRKFPRVNAHLKIGYEFVKWNENNLDKMEKPVYTKIFDISASGIGLHNLENLDSGILKKLETGKLKVRLALFLSINENPIITFARLIWSSHSAGGAPQRFGFIFLDVSETFFMEVKSFVDHELKKHK